jgi:hypothetical protein
MITATFDLTVGWTFDGEPSTDFGIRFTDGASTRVYPDGLAFGWSALVNGSDTASASWPPSNTVIRELGTTRVFPYRLDAAADDRVTLLLWATNAGATVEGETTFTIPRPRQPFPSWSWSEGRWQPPVPYPDGDGWYGWDETDGWVPVEGEQ